MTLDELTASNSARLAELAKPSWFIDDREYQIAAANFMHEAMTTIRKESNHAAKAVLPERTQQSATG